MKTYTIIAGVSGTGKSSFAGALRPAPSDVNAEEGFEKNISLIQETTLAGSATEYIAAKAKEQGYYIKMYYIGLNSLKECLARIKNRVRKGGHDVPEADVHREFAFRWDAVKKILPYCDETHFFDNDNGFVEVAEYRNGEVVSIGELRPDWLKELQDYLRNANALGEYYE